ncbi:MAG: CDP-alcohol phosphatidyltransferase family protein [Oscillospiraceae bacterium]
MKKEYFTIPNIMGYFRILMIPIFLILYLNAETTSGYVVAFAVLIVSMLTDFFDGKIARRFNMVTDFGKALDPVADKLTLGTLAIAVTSHYPFMIAFFVLFLIKELYMLSMGLYLTKKKKIYYSAKWYGKICTAATDICMVVLLVFTDLPQKAANIIIVCLMALMIFTLIKYILYHQKLLQDYNAEIKES